MNSEIIRKFLTNRGNTVLFMKEKSNKRFTFDNIEDVPIDFLASIVSGKDLYYINNVDSIKYIFDNEHIDGKIYLDILIKLGFNNLKTEYHNIVDILFFITTVRNAILEEYNKNDLSIISSFSAKGLASILVRNTEMFFADSKEEKKRIEEISKTKYSILFNSVISGKYLKKYTFIKNDNIIRFCDLSILYNQFNYDYTDMSELFLGLYGSEMYNHHNDINNYKVIVYFTNINNIDQMLDKYDIDLPTNFEDNYKNKLTFLSNTIDSYDYHGIFKRNIPTIPPRIVEDEYDIYTYTIRELLDFYGIASLNNTKDKLILNWKDHESLINAIVKEYNIENKN